MSAIEPKHNMAVAITNVMSEVRRLEKADKNSHGNYKFTSVDDFKDHLRPLLAKQGLAVHCNQLKFEMYPMKNAKGGETMCAQFDFELSLFCALAATEPERLTVVLPFSGAQTTGAARSYAVKEWLKSKFLASSGDEDDADRLAPGEYSGKAKPMPKKEQRPLFDELYKELRALKSSAEIEAWGKENRSRIHTLDESWQDELRREAAELRGRFRVSPHGYDDLIIGFENQLRAAKDADDRLVIWERIEDYAATEAIKPEDMNRLRLLVPEMA